MDEMQKIPLDIVGSTKFGRYPKISVEQTWNMIISDNALVDYAGYEIWREIEPEGEGRELYNSTTYNHLIAVVNDGVYTVDSGGGISKVGTLATTTGNVFIAENNNKQIGIVDGLNIYVFNYGTVSFTTIRGIDIDMRPVYITYQDTYFIVADGNSNQWRLSNQSEGTQYPASANRVGLLESKPDLTQAVVAFNRQLFVFGKTCTEIWHDLGLQLFPYQRDNNISIDYGCLSAASIAARYGLVCWLAANETGGPTIMYSTGGAPKQISNDGISYLLSQLKNPEDSYGFLFKQDGHVIYQLTFKKANFTLGYDFNTESFFNFSDHNLNYHIARRVAYFNNAYYFLSFNDASLYQISSQITSYDGKEIPRIRIGKHVRLPDGSRFCINNINITLEQGESKFPQRVDLSFSHDGGASFGGVVSGELNPLGDRQNQFQFWQLGSGNDIVPQYRFWSKGRFVVIGGEMEVYQ